MASSGDQIRQSDVTFWGVAALVVASFALLVANLAALLPPGWSTGLHSSPVDGGSLARIGAEIEQLRTETARLRDQNSQLMMMATLAEESRGEVTRRVGALETTFPSIIEAMRTAPPAAVDQTITTAAIGNQRLTVGQNSGVSVTTRPLAPDGSIMEPQPAEQPVEESPHETPEPAHTGHLDPAVAAPVPATRVATTPPAAYGIALGPQVNVENAFAAWKDISSKVGPLLLGLGPLLSGNAGVEQQRLVAGPIPDYAQAEQLCIRMIRVGISCLPVPYAGQTLEPGQTATGH